MTRMLVAGDVVLSQNLVHLPGAVTAPGADIKTTPGGAWHLHDLMGAACSDLPAVTVQGPPAAKPGDEAYARSIAIWSAHERTTGARDRVWRAERLLGATPASALAVAPAAAPATAPASAGDPPRLIVLNDENLGFRNNPLLWPAELEQDGGAEILLKTTSPLGQGRLWTHLLSRAADRLTVVLSATSLRARQAALSQALSWDRTIEELHREFTVGPSSHDLALARRVVIHFRGAGVAVFVRPPGQAMALERFIYHPEELEGVWHARRPGESFGATAILAAAFARHMLDADTYPVFVAAGRALAAIRTAHDRGAGTVKGTTAADMLNSFAPAETARSLTALLHPPGSVPMWDLPEAEFRTAFPRTLLGEPEPVPFRSDLLQDLTGRGYEYVAATAAQVVLQGVQALASAPKARYGAFLTVDREEIERINEIRRLIASYRTNEADRKPLSLAVFGPPGSGKSFAIKQLAEELFGRSQAVLEFNLSQFATREELHQAFDQVRDAAIRGKVPLVFWDEFDTGNLTWLKDFLAPMQDAEYRAGSIAHPFGKAIFVFAGGTCAAFQQFDRSRAGGAVEEQFRLAKGPDFVSRLRGYVNIKGPNPTGPNDVAHLIRRGLLLRSVLERSYPRLVDPATGRAAVSASVIRGFLRTQAFLHGARSLEAVVTMSALAGARHFGVGELPTSDLLALHVTPDFSRWIAEGELEEGPIERVAAAAHRAWVEQRRAGGWTHGSVLSAEAKTHPHMVGFADLPAAEQERGRQQSRTRLAILHQVGYRVVPAALAGAGGVAALPPEDRRRLNAIEHDAWLRDLLLRGYSHSQRPNPRLRLREGLRARLSEADEQVTGIIIDAQLAELQRAGYRLIHTARARDRVTVAAVGHRTLHDIDAVQTGIRTALERIRSAYGGVPMTLCTALAEGADRLLAEAVLQTPGGELVAVLPFSRAEFAKDFGTEGSPSRLHFEALLARCSQVIELPGAPSRELGYALQNKELLDRCDVVLAVWDGNGPHGAGGTGETVALAREMNLPVVVVRAGNGGGAIPDQGRVLTERFGQ